MIRIHNVKLKQVMTQSARVQKVEGELVDALKGLQETFEKLRQHTEDEEKE